MLPNMTFFGHTSL